MTVIFFSLFALVIFKNLLFWCALWQLKEYRLDRFWYFLKTPEGRSSLFNKSFIFELLAWAILFLFDWLSGLAWRWPISAFGSPWILSVGWSSGLKFVSIVFAVELIWFFITLAKKTFFKPVWTKKILLILVCSWVLATLIFYLTRSLTVLNFAVKAALLLNLLALPIVGLVILAFYPLSYYLKQRVIRRAREKINRLSSLKIIGITGSYGKTSVKEFTYQLLKDHFKVVKTLKNNNSAMGVAQTVVNNNFTGQEVFIAEMAAYKIGEIKKICQICPPHVAVLTGIDQQHSALFGGQQNIVTAKSEIIFNSKANAWLILNYDNGFIREIKIPAGKKVLTYGLDYQSVDLSAKNISFKNGWQSFELVYQDQKVSCKTSLLGKHNILNILGAVGAGLAVGLKFEELAKNIAQLEPVERTMKLIKKNNLFLIDDSYNANPSGVLAAIETLADFKIPKVIVLDDILEVGAENQLVHFKVAKKLSELDQAEKIILCGKNFGKFIKAELLKNKFPEKKIILSSASRGEDRDYLKSLADSMAKVVLFEGWRSQNYLNYFLNH